MGPDRRVRILIVDDSAVMRSMLRMVVGKSPSFEVAGTAADGESALQAVDSLRPDLILLDVEMPVMDGLVTLKKLRARGNRAPVIMCSSLTQRGARVTIEALAGGAADYVAKPNGSDSREAALSMLAQELLPKVKALTGQAAAPSETGFSRLFTRPTPFPAPISTPARMPSGPLALLAIGVSTGGPAALDTVLPALGSQFPLPVVVVQHMPELFTGTLAERLDGRCGLRVREAAEGCPVDPGTVYIARGDWHVEILPGARPGRGRLHLTQAPPQNHCRPSVDVMLHTAASVYGGGVLAVVLTGMGSDGLSGCRAVRGAGGIVLAQDQATSAVWGMPGVVTMAGLAHKVLPLESMAPEILRLASGIAEIDKPARETVA